MISRAGLLPGSVVQCCAVWGIQQRAARQKVQLKQLYKISGANYEPGGREFESLRARQFKLEVSNG